MKLKPVEASLSSDFAEAIKKASGENIYICFQCKKCTVGCPLMFAMDMTPTQIIHAIRQGVDIARIMDGVKIIAQQRGIKPPVISVPAFYNAALTNVKIFGRMYELGLIADLKRRTGEFTKDMGMGIKMFSKGKLKIIPHYSARARRIFNRVKQLERNKP